MSRVGTAGYRFFSVRHDFRGHSQAFHLLVHLADETQHETGLKVLLNEREQGINVGGVLTAQVYEATMQRGQASEASTHIDNHTQKIRKNQGVSSRLGTAANTPKRRGISNTRLIDTTPFAWFALVNRLVICRAGRRYSYEAH